MVLSVGIAMAKPPQAGTVPLYDQANASSKVVNHISLSDTLVPIYQSPKHPDWIKVGDQQTGQVGWLSKSRYQKAVRIANQQRHQVTLYSEPKMTSKPVVTITSDTPLTTIVSSKDNKWAKVGDQQTGQVGWINLKAYQQAQQQPRYFPSPVAIPTGNGFNNQTNSVYITVNNQNGKQQITAYRNGQKLSDKQAKHLWKKMQHRQQNMLVQDQRMQHQMDREINQMMQQFN